MRNKIITIITNSGNEHIGLCTAAVKNTNLPGGGFIDLKVARPRLRNGSKSGFTTERHYRINIFNIKHKS